MEFYFYLKNNDTTAKSLRKVSQRWPEKYKTGRSCPWHWIPTILFYPLAEEINLLSWIFKYKTRSKWHILKKPFLFLRAYHTETTTDTSLNGITYWRFTCILLGESSAWRPGDIRKIHNRSNISRYMLLSNVRRIEELTKITVGKYSRSTISAFHIRFT